MDWSNETYVRLYVRDTRTWLRLGFEGQVVFMALLRKVNRIGLLDTDGDDPAETLLLLTGWTSPVAADVVGEGLQRCIDQGAVIYDGRCLAVPNFVEAQTAKSTSRKRAREHRARERDRKAAEDARFHSERDVRNRNDSHGSVTPRDGERVDDRNDSHGSVTTRDASGETPDRNESLGSVTPRYGSVTDRSVSSRGVDGSSRSTLHYATLRYAEGGDADETPPASESGNPPGPGTGGGGGASEGLWRPFLHQLNAACSAHVPAIPVKRAAPPGLAELLDVYGAKYALDVYTRYAQLCATDADQREFWSPTRLFRDGVFGVADRLVNAPEGSGKRGGAGRGPNASRGRRGAAQDASLSVVPPSLATVEAAEAPVDVDGVDVDDAAEALLRAADHITANAETQ